jgi:hypothetical protein
MAAGAIDHRLERLVREETLPCRCGASSTRRPGLSEEAKDGLRRLIDAHPEHPEQALLEHLRCLRSTTAA